MDWFPTNWFPWNLFAIDWLPVDWLVYILPERWLISICQSAKARHAVFSRYDIANEVIRISNNIVVKCGWNVGPGEAAIQKFAAQKLNHRGILRVPHVYRYFQVSCPKFGWPKGYFFMEYIPGPTLDQEEIDLSRIAVAENVCERLAEAVLEMSSITDDNNGIPGPVGGGNPLKGYLWGDDGTKVILNSVDDLNHWLNKRLKIINKAIDLHPYPFVLCHLDLTRRNIKFMGEYNKKANSNYSICLLDWGHAGLFPRCFELAAAPCINDDSDNYLYEDCLVQTIAAVMGPSEQERNDVNLLRRARGASLRYIL